MSGFAVCLDASGSPAYFPFLLIGVTDTQLTTIESLLSPVDLMIGADARKEAKDAQLRKARFEQIQAKKNAPASLCVFDELAWVPTTDGVLTVRQVLEQAHQLKGFGEQLTGAEYSSLTRLFASFIALGARDQGNVVVPAGAFDEGFIDRVAEQVKPYTNLFDAQRPFMQTAVHMLGEVKPLPKAPDLSYSPSRLDPWRISAGTEGFFNRMLPPATYSLPRAVLALCVYNSHTLMSNSARLEGVGITYGAPGLHYVGEKSTSVEVMFSGDNLFETLMMITPMSWASSGGLPAWMDQDCERSNADGAPLPLWYQTWSPTKVLCTWSEDRTELVHVRIGGGMPTYPVIAQDPSISSASERKADYNKRFVAYRQNREMTDPYYLWGETLNAAGKKRRHMYRPTFALSMGHALASWHSGEAAGKLTEATTRFMMQPDQYCHVNFMVHVTGGTASSPSLDSSSRFYEDSGTWMSASVRAEHLKDAGTLLLELEKKIRSAWVRIERKKQAVTSSDFSATRLPGVAATAFWDHINRATVEYFRETNQIDGTHYWQKVLEAVAAAFDQTSSTLAEPEMLGWVEAQRAQLMKYVSQKLESMN